MAKGKMPAFMMAKFEKSAADKKMDAKKGAPKEGSKADMKADKAGMKAMAYKKGGMATKSMAYKKGGMVKGGKGC
jgi:hypothetical protein